jgi:hypothetical protein
MALLVSHWDVGLFKVEVCRPETAGPAPSLKSEISELKAVLSKDSAPGPSSEFGAGPVFLPGWHCDGAVANLNDR